MKKIITPKQIQREVAEYYCDFTGKLMNKGCGPAATVVIHCGYESRRDCNQYELHLSDEGLEELMRMLRLRMFPRKMADSGRDVGIDGESDGPVLPGPEDSMTYHELLHEIKLPTPAENDSKT